MIKNGIIDKALSWCCRWMIYRHIDALMESYLTSTNPHKYGVYGALSDLKYSLEIYDLTPRTLGAVWNRVADLQERLGVNDE